MNNKLVFLFFFILSLYVLPANVCAEMIVNGDFDAGMGGWGNWGSGSGSGPSGYKWTQHWANIEPTGGSDGGQFINLTTASQIGYCEWWGWGYNVIWRSDTAELAPATQGDVFKMGAYVKDLTGNGGTAEFKFEWLDINGVKEGDGGLVPAESVTFGVTTDWQWYEATKTTPENAYYLRPVYGNSSPGKEVGFDGVSLMPGWPKKANHPVPANNTKDIDLDVVLGWDSPGLVTDPTYNVYFGSESVDLSQAATWLVETIFDPCGPDDLAEETKYHWRVDVYDPNIGGNPAIYTGDEWSFTTLTWPAFCPAEDLNGDCVIDIKDLLLVAQQWLMTTDMADFAALSNNWLGGAGGPVVISEIMASNGNTLDDSDGDSSDWIELYNLADSDVDLTGWSLRDGINQWDFPGGLSLGTHEFLVVFASDKNRLDPNELHTNFKLSKDGEYLALVKDDGVTIAHAFDPNFPSQRENISYGLFKNKEYYFGQATPGRANVDQVYEGLVKDTKFSVDRGFYEAPFDVTVTCKTPGTTIYYTLDGTEPNESSFEYTNPVSINATTCLRAKAFKPDWMPTNTDTQTYILNASALVKSLPVISIVGDAQKSLYEPDGIMAIVGGYYDNGWWTSDGPESYNNPIHRGMAYERPVSVELIKSVDNSGFQIDCGIRVQGSDYHRPHYTRGDDWSGWTYNKFSFKFYFRSDYGDAKLHYQMFPREALDVFDRLTIRGGHNDPYNPFIKDELIRRLHKDMGSVASSGTFANLYINGEYKAYYNPCEYLDEEFFQSWYDSDEKWDVITQRTLRDGDYVTWYEMLNYVDDNDLSNPTHYLEVGNRLDIEDFVDYLIVQLYCGNWDWPSNNWTAAREQSTEGRFRFYVWDAEGAMDSWAVGENLDKTGFDDFPTWIWPAGLNNLNDPMSRIYRGLKANDDFKLLFADRIHKFFFNHGALVNSNVSARFFELRDEVLGVIPSIDMYIPNTFIPGRRDPMLNKFVFEGLFTYDPNAPIFNINGSYQHGGTIDYGDTLSISNPNPTGTIYYTLDGSDPRQAFTGNAVGTPYTGSITLTENVQVKARILNGVDWSPLNEATYASQVLFINEFMASNSTTITDPQGQFDDWIEIYNVHTSTVDIGGMYLRDSINQRQIPDDRPAETAISPGGYLIIWADSDIGDTPGVHAGFKLDAGGDEIHLYASDNFTLIDSITYSTQQLTDESFGRYPDGTGNWGVHVTATPLAVNGPHVP